MKKIAKALTAILLLSALLTGCAKSDPETPADSATATAEHSGTTNRVWDGSVASGFSGGSGTAEDPYRIRSAAELAYLAETVNSGKETYSGKTVALAQDIDLNQIEWTPIGDGIHAFMGNFNGNGHTIKNLKISQTIRYSYEYPTGRKAVYCDSGLFAAVQDASIQNMKIDGVAIQISDTKSGDTHSVGVLCGTVRTYQSISVISNIAIKNATITANFPANRRPQWLSIGGVIGKVYANNQTTTTISLVETDSTLSLENGYGANNYMGTVLGSSNMMDSTFRMENCAAYQILSVNPEQYYYTVTNNFSGAIGNAQASAKPFTVKNVFSKATLRKPALDSTLTAPPAIVSHVIIGEAYYFVAQDDPAAVGYQFENVFGCVVHTDSKAGGKQILTHLYVLPEGHTFSQINCCGCEVLPENHGLDATIWNLTDLENPRLK